MAESVGFKSVGYCRTRAHEFQAIMLSTKPHCHSPLLSASNYRLSLKVAIKWRLGYIHSYLWQFPLHLKSLSNKSEELSSFAFSMTSYCFSELFRSIYNPLHCTMCQDFIVVLYTVPLHPLQRALKYIKGPSVQRKCQ